MGLQWGVTGLRTPIPSVAVIPSRLPCGSTAWQVDTVDDYLFHDRLRVAGALNRALRQDWDVVVLTTASSYLNTAALISALTPRVDASGYGGRLVHYRSPVSPPGSGLAFASGSFTYLSRDFLLAAQGELMTLSPRVHADVGLGLLARSLGRNPASLPSLDVESVADVERLTTHQVLHTPHFRVKAGSWANRQDVLVMRHLHERLEDARGAG